MTTSLFRYLHLASVTKRTLNYSATNFPPHRNIFLGRAVAMANSKFSYVRSFEKDDKLPSQQWIVISLENLPNDLSKFSLKSANSRDKYTDLMRTASLLVMNQFKDISVAYVDFNKIHFVLAKDSTLYQRRSNKLLTYFGSCLTSAFERSWPQHFTEEHHQWIPYFDGRIHLFPNDQLFRDYFTNLQLSHHCINLKQTLHLAIQEYKLKTLAVGSADVVGASNSISKATAAATTTLQEVPENEKESYYNQVLFSVFGINYNNEPEVYKKGFILLRQRVQISLEDDAYEKSIADVAEKKTDFLTRQGDEEASDIEETLVPVVGKRADIRRRQRNKEAAIAGRTSSEIAVMSPDFKLSSFWLESALINDKTSFNFKCAGLGNYAVGEWLLPHAWIVVRIDGKAFHKLSKDHNFDKPNDLRAINLMNIAAVEVMNKMSDIIFGFGESDEFSFVVNRYSKQSDRHSTSLVSQCVTLFTSAYVSNWPKVFDANCLKYDPMFDGRAVLYPTNTSLRDYLSWRQADCHINNMYNTVFWKLIQLKNLTNKESEELLRGTFSADKRRLLLDMGIDYDLEPVIHRKGSILFRIVDGEESFLKGLSLASNSSDTKKPKTDSNTNESYEKPWWNSDCEEIKIQRKSVRKKCQLQATLQNFEELKACEALSKKIFKTAKQNFARLSNGSNPVFLVESDSCSKYGSSDLLGTVSDRSKEVNHTARDMIPSTATSKVHEESASEALLNGESGSACIPKGFDKRGNPWWNVECHMAKTARTLAKSAFMRSPSATTDKCFRECEINLKVAIKAAKKEYKRLLDTPGSKISTGSDQPPANFPQIRSDEGTLDCSITKINGNLENVDGVNDFSNDDYKIEELLVSTLREGLSGTPSMPTDDHADLYNFANSSTKLEAYADMSKEFDAQADDYTKFTNSSDELTDLTDAQEKDTLDKTIVGVKSEENAFLFEDAIVTDSGYNSSSLRGESTRECNDQEAQSISAGGGIKNSIGCDEYKMMGGNICLCHVDIIKDDFWNRNPHILGQEKSNLSFDEDY